MKRTSFMFYLLLLISSQSSASMILETFEDEVVGATSFTQDGFAFSVDGDFRIENFGSYGSGPSDFWLGTGSFSQDGGTVGNTGSIIIDGANNYFTLTSFDAWTSNDNGSSFIVGFITLEAIEFGTGNIFNTSVFVEPTGVFGGDWDMSISLAGTSLEGLRMSSISANLDQSGINYLALDNLNIRVAQVNAPATLLIFITSFVIMIFSCRSRV